MKKLFVTMLMASQLATAGAALSATVDFTQVPSPPVDITLPNSLTLQGITFSYDSTPAGVGAANVDTLGIHGDTGVIINDPNFGPVELLNTLTIDFSALSILPYILKVDFNLNGLTVNDLLALEADFFLGGNFQTALFVPLTSANPVGTLDYTFGQPGYAGMFDMVVLMFTPDAATFDVTGISYEPVPEPSTMILLAAGLLGLGGLRFARRRT